MNIVKAGDSYQIYGDAIETYDKLPNGTYSVVFNKMTGFYLETHDDLTVKEKIYGNVPDRVEKILSSFDKTERNFGVILSGTKGSGKSMTVRHLAEKANCPILIVDKAYYNLADFITSIKQKCVVIFDEFEKMYKDNNSRFSNKGDDAPQQDSLLSLFDGIDGGNKLFILTCNEVGDLSAFLKNRPGRFHYHFKYGLPSSEEMREYLKDNLDEEKHTQINNIIKCSCVAELTYDCLRAICTELNAGYTLGSTLTDLNIDVTSKRYVIKLALTNGQVITSKEMFTLFSSEKLDLAARIDGDVFNFRFTASDILQDDSGVLYVPKADIEMSREDDDWDTPNEIVEDCNGVTIKECIIIPDNPKTNNFSFLGI